MTTTTDIKRIRRLVVDRLRRDVSESNGGMLACLAHTPLSDLQYLREHAVIKPDGVGNDYVEVDGVPTWTIKRRYANRKVNGSYRQLMPEVVPYIPPDPKKLAFWASVNASWANQDF